MSTRSTGIPHLRSRLALGSFKDPFDSVPDTGFYMEPSVSDPTRGYIRHRDREMFEREAPDYLHDGLFTFQQVTEWIRDTLQACANRPLD